MTTMRFENSVPLVRNMPHLGLWLGGIASGHGGALSVGSFLTGRQPLETFFSRRAVGVRDNGARYDNEYHPDAIFEEYFDMESERRLRR